MRSNETGTLDEAYQRLHVTGPEFGGWLSNHGPMAAEAMVRHGSGRRDLRPAVEHGDEHVIKFADTAAGVYARTGDRDALAAAVRATQLTDR